MRSSLSNWWYGTTPAVAVAKANDEQKPNDEQKHDVKQSPIEETKQEVNAEQKLDSYKILLLSLDNESKYDLVELDKLSTVNGHAPILIKKGDSFAVYGNAVVPGKIEFNEEDSVFYQPAVATEWKITQLNPNKFGSEFFGTAAKGAPKKNLVFPGPHHPAIVSNIIELPSGVLSEILAEKAHSPGIGFCLNVAKICGQWRKDTIENLRSMLDEDAFAAVMSDKVSFHEKDDKYIFYYKNLLKLLEELEPFFEILNGFTSHGEEVLTPEVSLLHIISEGWNRYSDIKDLIYKFRPRLLELLDTIDRLGLNSIVPELPGMKHIKWLINEFVPYKKIGEHVFANPLVQAGEALIESKITDAKDVIQKQNLLAAQINKQLNIWAKDFLAMLQKLTQKEGLEEKVKATIVASIANLEKLIAGIEEFNKTEPKLFNSIDYAYQMRMDANALLQNIPTDLLDLKMNSQDILVNSLQSGEAMLESQHFYHLNQDILVNQIIVKMHGWARDLWEVLHKVTENEEIAVDVRISISSTVGNLGTLITRISEFNKTDKNILETLFFAYTVRHEIYSLIKTIPSAYVTLNKVLRKHLLHLAQELNLIFQELFLHADMLERKYHLKDGYFTTILNIQEYSISSFAKKFNDWIKSFKIKYDFKKEERFPYNRALLQQRQFALETETLSSMARDILQKRIRSAEEKIQLEEREQKDKFERLNLGDLYSRPNRIKDLIERRKEELNDENLHHSSSHKIIKLKLLDRLEHELVDEKKNLDEAFSSIKEDKDLDVKSSGYLLWEGRTRNTLVDIQNILSTPDNRIELIDVAIADLKNQRKQHHLLTSTKTLESYEECIAALESLKNLMKTQGYLVNNALDEINSANPAYYQVLKSLQKDLIYKIDQIDKNLPPYVVGEAILDFVKNPVVSVPEQKPNIVQFQIREISARMDELLSERESWTYRLVSYFNGDTKLKKINLLRELLNQLNGKNAPTIETSLEKVAHNPALRPHIYLLYEGRTGKLLQELSNMAAVPQQDLIELQFGKPGESLKHAIYQATPLPKIIATIKLDLVRLKDKRHDNLTFFPRAGKKSIEEQIAVLSKLQKSLEHGDNLQISLEQFNPHELTILKSNCKPILEDLRKLDQAGILSKIKEALSRREPLAVILEQLSPYELRVVHSNYDPLLKDISQWEKANKPVIRRQVS